MENKVKKLLKDLDFSSEESIKKFIREMDSDLYQGKYVDGEEVIVSIQKGVGMKVMSDSNNPNILKIIDYSIDEDGKLIVEEIYEPK